MMPAADGNFSGRLRGLHLPNSPSEKAGTPCGVPALRCMAMLGVLKKNMLNIVLFIILGALWWGGMSERTLPPLGRVFAFDSHRLWVGSSLRAGLPNCLLLRMA